MIEYVFRGALMDKKAIKTILNFIKAIKAPSTMIPVIVALVITFVRRFAESDKAASVKTEDQGFVCRKSMDIAGGCGSPAVAVQGDGKVAVAFACSRVVDDVPVYSLCLSRSDDLQKMSASKRTFLFDSPMQIGNVTATSTPDGLLISWRTKIPSKLHIPSDTTKEAARILTERNAQLFSQLSADDKQGGTYYMILPDKADSMQSVTKAPCNITQGAVRLSDNEYLWMGECDGAAVAYKSTDKCRTFAKCGAVPAIPGGRTVAQVSCAKIKNGRIICVFASQGELFISYSDDIGARWSLPHMLNVRGTSPNLCVRSDGVTALSYVQPEKKISLRSMISPDGQYKWFDERALVISTADNCRRPYTAEVEGKFITVSRQRFAGEKESSVIYTLWEPHKEDKALIEEADESKKSSGKKKKKK